LNGTDKIVILGKKTITAMVEGFLHGLDEKSESSDVGNLRQAFIEFFRQFNPEQIIEIIKKMLESNHPDSSETAVIQKNLESHGKLLYSIFKNL
jgi:hypothetical protein